jgi:hypothetical protein
MTHVSGRVYTATIRFRSSSAGEATLWVSGYDSADHYRRTALKLPLG